MFLFLLFRICDFLFLYPLSQIFLLFNKIFLIIGLVNILTVGEKMSNPSKESVEAVLTKINWAQEILNSVQQNITDPQIGNILSGIAFIMDSASSEAEALYQSIE